MGWEQQDASLYQFNFIISSQFYNLLERARLRIGCRAGAAWWVRDLESPGVALVESPIVPQNIVDPRLAQPQPPDSLLLCHNCFHRNFQHVAATKWQWHATSVLSGGPNDPLG